MLPASTVIAPWAAETDDPSSRELHAWLRSTAERVVLDTLGQQPTEIDGYADRLWGALLVHFAKRGFEPTSIDEVDAFVRRLEDGELHYGRVRENVVADVIVAYGLEQHSNEAAAVFQRDYMPIVRFHANRFAGQRGVDAVENLAADLVLPRPGRPPKIATYRGLTPMKAWLRSVVVNQCVGAHRSQRETSLGDTVEIATEDTVETTVFTTDCEQKLAPTFRDAVGNLPTVDRVLLKMLILDGAPQKAVAQAQGVDSGTLTRRRQRAAGKLLEEIQRIGQSGGASQPVNECLDLLLAGRVSDLQTRLATLLAAPFQDSEGANGSPL